MVGRRLSRTRAGSLILSINLLGDWLRDALNPKLQ
jgi:ABC-type dipeptide/oligopeptide/nickel transport system permease subunit